MAAMPLILHLSDLHLSELTAAQITGDYKVAGLVPLPERQNRLDLVRTSLGALARWLDGNGRVLDAVVITGDVSLAYSETGFAALEETLAALGDRMVPPARVAVVPGNHDVDWFNPDERYTLFLKHVRGCGFVTPLLEGIDIDAATGQRIDQPNPPVVGGSQAAFVIFAMNSAHYSGAKLRLPDPAVAAFEAARTAVAPDSEAQRSLDSLLRHDIARVSPAQLIALRDAMAQYPQPSFGGPIRIVALHHQLLPVSPDEEFKSFENLTNLGQVRAFLAAQQVSLVLHGHKHQSVDYVDLPAQTVGGVAPSPYLVSSAATVWRQSAFGHEFARLVEVDARYPRARTITLHSVTATGAGAELGAPHTLRVWRVRFAAGEAENAPIAGATVDDVYDQLQVRFDSSQGRPIRQLVCTIEDGSTALRVPSSLPPVPGVVDPQAWLEETVAWWQRGDPDVASRGRRFNHGERIRHFTDRGDQIAAVVQALKDAPGTTRAIIQLIDPTRDNIADTSQRIPAFFSCHFLIRQHEELLDCIAYFRKQQVRMWWPVNVAEVARLQLEVVEKLADVGLQLRTGSITTIAALAVDGTNKPKVIVPRVDRRAHDAPQYLWALMYDLFFGDFDRAQEEFHGLFQDWQPTGQPEPDGSAISIGGIELLFQAATVFSDRSNNSAGRRLARALQDLYDSNRAYADSEENTADVSERRVQYERWAGQVGRLLEDIRESLAHLRDP